MEITYKSGECDIKERRKRDSKRSWGGVKLARQQDLKSGIGMGERGLDVAGMEFENICQPLKKVTSYHCRIDHSKVGNTRIQVA